ncbi:MAG: serine/threonine-protein phosphatase [Candidatus Omnitrophica bacterium]|nr:serine/threonine-protein phosphatase [Candidatus Omnitrophota bacterium]
MIEQIGCGKIWGGNRNVDVDLCTSSLETSLCSFSCRGGKGGDIYYYSVCSTDRLSRIVLGDVVGHGDEVSHISGWVYDSLKKYQNNLAGNEILIGLNNAICERGLDAMTTAVVVAYFLGDKNFYFSYAGHHPALIRRKGESEWKPADIQSSQKIANLPLGIQKDIQYEQRHIQLQSGDCFFLYTDGVIEAQNACEELYGVNRLLCVLNEISENNPQRIKKAVMRDVGEYCNGKMNHDDVTAIAIKIH